MSVGSFTIYGSRISPPVAVGSSRTNRETVCDRKEIQGRSPEKRRGMGELRSRPLPGSLKQWLEETLGTAFQDARRWQFD